MIRRKAVVRIRRFEIPRAGLQPGHLAPARRTSQSGLRLLDDCRQAVPPQLPAVAETGRVLHTSAQTGTALIENKKIL